MFLQDAGGDQRLEAPAQHVAGDAEAGLERLEAAQAAEGVADDQQAPPLADNLEGLGDGAFPIVEACAFLVLTVGSVESWLTG